MGRGEKREGDKGTRGEKSKERMLEVAVMRLRDVKSMCDVIKMTRERQIMKNGCLDNNIWWNVKCSALICITFLRSHQCDVNGCGAVMIDEGRASLITEEH